MESAKSSPFALHKVGEISKKNPKWFWRRCPSSFERTFNRSQKHTGCEKRSQILRSRLVLPPRGITRQSRCKSRSCDSCWKPWSQPDPIRSYKSFRNFGAWFCTTETPKLLTWLKNVLIRHTFVLKFEICTKQSESAKGNYRVHVNQDRFQFWLW